MYDIASLYYLKVVYERSEFYTLRYSNRSRYSLIVEEIEMKAEYMGGLADRILRCR